jgi:hypothetical protein
MMRPKHVLALAAAALVGSCGGASYQMAEPQAYDGEPAGWAGGGEEQEAMATAETERAARMAQAAEERPRDLPMAPQAAAMPARKMAAWGAPGKASPAPVSQQMPSYGPSPKAKQVEVEKPTLEKAMVVYMGYLKLRVQRRLEAIDAVTKLTESRGGYIDSLGRTVIVVRIPATDFDAVLAEFARIGEVLDRRVSALDVSQQYTDLEARRAVANEARTRLLALLATVKDAEERLRIVEEVKRLSEVIESIDSKLSTLRNLASYFTITVELVPVVREGTASAHVSPFAWVRELKPHLQTIADGKDEIALTLPEAFVLFDAADEYRAQAADTSMIRAGRVDNEPRGDNLFWIKALGYEMDGRDEEQVEAGDAGRLKWLAFRNKDLRPRYYVVAVHAAGEDLYVVEAFFPNEEAWKRHRAAVVAALATFAVK